ncbi:MAG: glycosyl hydrolase 53 family protein, partial [Flavobacterium sp.]|nr:glycosyl hydrolase 53 family protein [Flavobacterium sp.]
MNGNSSKIILHHSNALNANYFYQELVNYNLDYDIIEISYYPQYRTKDLNILQTKLNNLALTCNKQFMIVEVAYPFSLNYTDN